MYPVAAHYTQWNLPSYLSYPGPMTPFAPPPLELRPVGERYLVAQAEFSSRTAWRWLYLGSGCHQSDNTICKIVNWVFGYSKEELEAKPENTSSNDSHLITTTTTMMTQENTQADSHTNWMGIMGWGLFYSSLSIIPCAVYAITYKRWTSQEKASVFENDPLNIV